MKKMIAFVLVMVLVLLALVACDNDGNVLDNNDDSRLNGENRDNPQTIEEQLIGRWELIEGSTVFSELIFFEENIAVRHNNATWQLIDDDIIRFEAEYEDPWHQDHEFHIVGGILYLDGTSFIKTPSFVDRQNSDIILVGRWDEYDSPHYDFIVFFLDGSYATGEADVLWRVGGANGDRLYWFHIENDADPEGMRMELDSKSLRLTILGYEPNETETLVFRRVS